MNKLILILAVFGTIVTVRAQKTISGKVLEKDTNTPLIGVSVLVKGTNTGTTTDFDGNYSLANIGNNDILEFSYIGYSTKEILVGDQTTINVFMDINAEQMDEVVVTALNIQRDKESLGYSVSQVSSEEVNVARENNIMNSLSGKVSGLQITQSNTGVDGSSRTP